MAGKGYLIILYCTVGYDPSRMMMYTVDGSLCVCVSNSEMM